METIKYNGHSSHSAFRAHSHTTYIILLLYAKHPLPWELCSYIGGYYYSLCQRLVAVADSFALIATHNAVYHYVIDDAGLGPRPLDDAIIVPGSNRVVPVRPCVIGPWADSSDITTQSFGSNVRILAISAGAGHGAILTNIGVFGCGSNQVGQLGTSIQSVDRAQMIKIFHRATAVSCGSHYTMLISDQTLYGCGSNNWGHFGVTAGTGVSTFRPMKQFADKRIIAISCQMSYSLVLTAEGVVHMVGRFGNSPGGCVVAATVASAIFTISNDRWCFKVSTARATRWFTRPSTGISSYSDWNTPHGRYYAPVETLLALYREQSCLNGEKHPTGLGIITAIAQNAVSKDCMVSTPNGVFFREGSGSRWIRL
jgi:hypothetical protein